VSARLSLAALLALATPVSAGEPALPVTVDLFQAGQGGYELYRIPGLVVTSKGTLLAYCEARKGSRSDWGTIDLLFRRSTDGGKTWSDPYPAGRVAGPHTKNPVALAQKLADPDTITYNNPVAIADRQAGTVHFLFCLEYMRCFYQRSDDDGVTFSKPVEITAAFEPFREKFAWKVLATGPGHGIRMTSGRLLVPVWLSTGTGGHAHRPSVVATIFSDDAGKTWKAGDIVASATDPLTNPNETAAEQLCDGQVVLNIRSESKENRRAVAFSKDGSSSWSRPAFDDALAEPVCFGSLCRLSAKPADDRDRLLFANPDHLGRADGKERPGQGRDRKNLTVRLSYDEGKTWAASRVLDPGPAAYCDLAAGSDGAIYCLYERGGYKTLTLARFDTAWLTAGKDRFPAK
jgi:sialidase-1